MTRMTRTMASKQRGEHVADRFAHRVGGIEGILVLHAGRKLLRQPVQFGHGQAVHFESVRGRELGDAEADGIVSVEHQVRAVILGAEFGAADIFQANQSAVGIASSE